MFIRARLRNLAENLIPATILKQKFVGKSCIILGGGTSLDNYIYWIKVDIVVSVGPQSPSFDVNKDFMQLERDVLLINSYHVAPQIMG
jgi:hypothetical protein